MPGMLRATINGTMTCPQCRVAVTLPTGGVLNFTCTKATNDPDWLLLTTLNAGTYTVQAFCPPTSSTCQSPAVKASIVNGQVKAITLDMPCLSVHDSHVYPLSLRIKGNTACRKVMVSLHSPPIPTTGGGPGPRDTAVYGPYKLTKEADEDCWVFPTKWVFPQGAYRAVAVCCTEPSLCQQAPMACFGDVVVEAVPHPPPRDLDISAPQKGDRAG